MKYNGYTIEELTDIKNMALTFIEAIDMQLEELKTEHANEIVLLKLENTNQLLALEDENARLKGEYSDLVENFADLKTNIIHQLKTHNV
ncbi:MAG: hypothetical protein ATN35_09030 [Epulopiscium sp. Nele67-Bin004]|nr:MAG: hypothetical protein ATN35_09030 [Epulopiscium sp. Nele67-Bin004]